MKKTTIYLVRHAEVENPEHIIYGRLPGFELSNRGRFQADKIRIWFSNKNIYTIITSPLERTKSTAKIISNGTIPIITNPDIIEADYKKWKGLKASDRDPGLVKAYTKNPGTINLGESLPHIEKRMSKAITSVLKKYPGKNIVMVSHADPILIARLSLEKKPLSDINKHELRNASITTLTFDGVANLINSGYNVIVDAKKDLP